MLVVDTSVAVKFVTEEVGSAQALDLIGGTDALIAPDWITVEAASALWAKVQRRDISQAHAEHGFQNLTAFFLQILPSLPLLGRAFALSFELGHPVYDCVFLALALREQAVLVTADEKFVKAVRRTGMTAQVRLLA